MGDHAKDADGRYEAKRDRAIAMMRAWAQEGENQ